MFHYHVTAKHVFEGKLLKNTYEIVSV